MALCAAQAQGHVALTQFLRRGVVINTGELCGNGADFNKGLQGRQCQDVRQILGASRQLQFNFNVHGVFEAGFLVEARWEIIFLIRRHGR